MILLKLPKSIFGQFLILITFFNSTLSVDLLDWDLFDQNTFYLAIHDLKMSKISNESPGPNGHPLYHWNPADQTWLHDSHLRAGIQVALGNDFVWLIDAHNQAHISPISMPNWNSKFVAYDLKVSSLDHTFYVSDFLTSNGKEIRQVTYPSETSTSVGLIGANKIAVDSNGLLWFMGMADDVWGYDGTTYESYGESATDIIVGSNSRPYILTKTGVDDGFEIKKWNAVTLAWELIDGIGGVGLALDINNQLYVVTSSGDVYRKRGLNYNFCPSRFFTLISSLKYYTSL